MGKQDFFLEPDDAKTFGDIDYMRQKVRVRHTFPGNKNNGGSFAIEKELNSMEERPASGTKSGESFTTPSISSTPTSQPKPRRSASSTDGMDMFRKMAKGIKR